MRRVAVVLAALLPLLLAGPLPASATPPPSRLEGLYDARQIVVVTNNSWTSAYATLTTFEKRSDGTWRRVHGPWGARVGRNGFGSPKREGDGQTPVGSYRIVSMFGVNASPGVRYTWHRMDRSDVWVDDSYSDYYNLHKRLPAKGRWRSAESLYQPTAYAYAATIGYNMSRTPGRGSAIFFHAGTGGATAGCVSIASSRLVPILRWLDPAKKPRFVMGPESAVTA
ncbi:MAG TPA: L,D-transpeptidase family protein [Frankiaceae bacterium]|nr:L,D-transpeptidase family protein [Frankiaceae bacterium]